MYLQALAGREKVLEEDDILTMFIVERCGDNLYNQKKLDDAEKMCSRALLFRSRSLGHDHPDTIELFRNLGLVYRDQKNFVKAEEMFTKVLEAFATTAKRESLDTRLMAQESMWELGCVCECLHRVEESQNWFLEALADYAWVFKDDAETHKSLRKIVAALEAREADDTAALVGIVNHGSAGETAQVQEQEQDSTPAEPHQPKPTLWTLGLRPAALQHRSPSPRPRPHPPVQEATDTVD